MKRKLSKFEHVSGPRVMTLDRKLRNEIRVLNEVIITVQEILRKKEDMRRKLRGSIKLDES